MLCSKPTAHLFLFIVLFLTGPRLMAESIRVAVSSNFLATLEAVAKVYEQESGDRLDIISGSTGKLYTQIANGAAYDVFLSANSSEPEELIRERHAVKNSRFTYARGRLVLWWPEASSNLGTVEDVLKKADYKWLALADSLHAPYGTAAEAVLIKLNLDKKLNRKLLRGKNIAQAYQYVDTGVADLGFVALSQLKLAKKYSQSSTWLVDESMHPRILQQAVLLNKSTKKEHAQLFLNFLKSAKGKAIIERSGYVIE